MEIDGELKQKMVEYLQQFEAGVKSAAEFSAEQAPLVVQEYLAWEFWMNFTVFVAGIAALAVGSWFGFKQYKRLDEWDKMPFQFVGPIAWLVVSGIAIGGAYHAAKVAIAPRLVVLEKVSTLLSK